MTCMRHLLLTNSMLILKEHKKREQIAFVIGFDKYKYFIGKQDVAGYIRQSGKKLFIF